MPADWRMKIKQWSDASKIPYFWAFQAVVMRREAGFNPAAQNKDANEVKASQDALANGLKRGNPSPKYGQELAAFGSGGLFGALGPYFGWIGLDENYMPFLRRKAATILNADAAAVFGCHYAWRILTYYRPKNRTMTWFDLRTGWASPSALKNSPDGTTAQAVRGRMVEDINALGLQWLANAPVPVPTLYPGINVVGPMFGFSAGQED